MIPTITTYLYEVNKHKSRMAYEAEKQRALWYIIGILVCVGLALSILLHA
jgi:hypothetical protein